MSVPDYPDDADGDALRRVAGSGSDMSKPMLVDFMIAAGAGATESIATGARALGYVAAIDRNDRGERTVYCSKQMLLDYDSVITAQRELDEMSAPFGGRTDGWGTSGNLEAPRP
ncbi:MAG TPA: ribonuclease E inhibitor RraB [Kofleriaceae bacterium]|nr:ribonuclease E inhibitor RraB [Kofleriaceae bacterium]